LIAILDYGSGNLRSAYRAFETTGRKVVLTSDPEIAISAAGLVVPGVGAFESCMNGLLAVNGDQIIKHRIANDSATFGICVGMQILFSEGVEHGSTAGISAVPGVVEKLKAKVLPHMGWNTVKVNGESKLFKGIASESFYFVHSYGVLTDGNSQRDARFNATAVTDYQGEFLAAFEMGCLSATQFHPEKSGAAGLKLIQNWASGL